MHLGHTASLEVIHPASIPPEYLSTQLAIIDVSSHTELNEEFILTLDVALQFMVLKHDPRDPTLVLFKFGWKEEDSMRRTISCTYEGCMSIAAPLKLVHANYVPTRLTAFCPSTKTEQGHVSLTLKKNTIGQASKSRLYDVNLDEIMSSEIP
ncbi:putative cyclase [Operophtera brumata]|uniref:Putative cyclase n=1 Tax=Operophtera brumata TaxID=104452 RepID=A0A0L7LHE8_OPEBR|nr:putative cyclase [Operophtera brumata]